MELAKSNKMNEPNIRWQMLMFGTPFIKDPIRRLSSPSKSQSSTNSSQSSLPVIDSNILSANNLPIYLPIIFSKLT